jgi:hypothetical protein
MSEFRVPGLSFGLAFTIDELPIEADGRARFIGHRAFDDPETPPDAPMRESIEIRTAAFF